MQDVEGGACHGESLAGPSLAVCTDGASVAVQNRIHDGTAARLHPATQPGSTTPTTQRVYCQTEIMR